MTAELGKTDKRRSTGPAKRQSDRAWGNDLVNREREVWRSHGWGGWTDPKDGVEKPEKAWPEARWKYSQQRDFFGRHVLMAFKRFEFSPCLVLIQVSSVHPSGPGHALGPLGLNTRLPPNSSPEGLLNSEVWQGSAVLEVYTWWRELEGRPDPMIPGSFRKRALPGGRHAGRMVWLVPDRRWWTPRVTDQG